MSELQKASFAILILPSDELVLQRRRKHTHFGEYLGFYGGSVEGQETPLQALERELQEETDLDPAQLYLRQIDEYPLQVSPERSLHFFAFLGRLSRAGFTDLDGGSPETYSFSELTTRQDLTPGSRAMINRLQQRSNNGLKPN